MAVCVVDLNDTELRAASGEKVLARSPGYAVIVDDAVHLGQQAAGRAHLHPQRSYNRFWAGLSQDALSRPTTVFRHHADMAHAHLSALHDQAGKPAEVIFAVPGSFAPDQLSLLLGIAQACPFKAVGLVDSAVAAAAAVAGPGSYLHMDIHLHQTVLTRLRVDSQVTRESVETIDNGGLTAIHDAVAERIADTFIQHSRFDPLHHAETEQALYDQIPRCLQVLADRPEVLLEIRFQETRHQARLLREALLPALERHYAGVLQRVEPGRTPLLGDRLAQLPGFAARMNGAHQLDAGAVFRGCLQHRDLIRGDGPHLNFITRLPTAQHPSIGTAAPPGAEVTGETTPRLPATHVLAGLRALPLAAGALYLSARGSVSGEHQESSACALVLDGGRAQITPLSDITMYVNGDRLTGTRSLVAGDRLSFAGSDTEYMLISVSGRDAP